MATFLILSIFAIISFFAIFNKLKNLAEPYFWG